MSFKNFKKVDNRTVTFTLENVHVSYANTLRRLILTGVETVAFRADMTDTGTTTDVFVKKNDTPMTNEMLADRIGLLPIHVNEPLSWKSDKYIFTLKVTGNKDSVRHVKSEDFKVTETNFEDEEDKKENPPLEDASKFFPPNPITRDTCLIASLQPGTETTMQEVYIVAKATIGSGREHARFCPVSQCSYEYTVDTDEKRMDEMFDKWLQDAKKVGAIDKASDRYHQLRREYNTMQSKRCFKVNEKGEPYSFDFTIETAGVLGIKYIVNRACEVGENMCAPYLHMEKGQLPPNVSITNSSSRILGFDFLIKEQDHTLGNLVQTWLVENIIEGDKSPKISYAGYSIPHPLRDEMLLRIGVKDGKEQTARLALQTAADGCRQMFKELRATWNNAYDVFERNPLASPRPIPIPARRRRPQGATAALSTGSKPAEDKPQEEKITVTKSS